MSKEVAKTDAPGAAAARPEPQPGQSFLFNDPLSLGPDWLAAGQGWDEGPTPGYATPGPVLHVQSVEGTKVGTLRVGDMAVVRQDGRIQIITKDEIDVASQVTEAVDAAPAPTKKSDKEKSDELDKKKSK